MGYDDDDDDDDDYDDYDDFDFIFGLGGDSPPSTTTSASSELTQQYLRRISPQLLPLSEDQTDPLRALAEWRCSLSPGSTIIYDSPVVCELCLEDSLLTHHLIENTQTAHTLWVGSTCIERPALAVYTVDGRQLDQEEVSAALKGEARRVQEEARLSRMSAHLRAGAAIDPDGPLYWSLIEKVLSESKGRLRPLRATYFLLVSKRLGLTHLRPGDLKINLRVTLDKEDFLWLRKEKPKVFDVLLPHLSPDQVKRFQ